MKELGGEVTMQVHQEIVTALNAVMNGKKDVTEDVKGAGKNVLPFVYAKRVLQCWLELGVCEELEPLRRKFCERLDGAVLSLMNAESTSCPDVAVMTKYCMKAIRMVLVRE